VEQSRLHVLEPTFFANGAEVGRGPGASPGVPNPTPGPPRRLAAQGGEGGGRGRGGSAPPLNQGLTSAIKKTTMSNIAFCRHGRAMAAATLCTLSNGDGDLRDASSLSSNNAPANSNSNSNTTWTGASA
jgi:hypothetical protein